MRIQNKVIQNFFYFYKITNKRKLVHKKHTEKPYNFIFYRFSSSSSFLSPSWSSGGGRGAGWGVSRFLPGVGGMSGKGEKGTVAGDGVWKQGGGCGVLTSCGDGVGGVVVNVPKKVVCCGCGEGSGGAV